MQDILEVYVVGRLQPFEEHHFRCDDLGTVCLHPVDCRRPVVIGPRANGIGYDKHTARGRP